jgi:hypothetical protein
MAARIHGWRSERLAPRGPVRFHPSASLRVAWFGSEGPEATGGCGFLKPHADTGVRGGHTVLRHARAVRMAMGDWAEIQPRRRL